MISEILISNEKNNFYKLFVNENGKNKPIRINIESINLPFGLEDFNNKIIINFELDDSKSSKEYEKLVRLVEKNITSLIEIDDIDVKSVLYEKEEKPTLCRAYIKKNRNKIITTYKVDENDVSIYDIVKNEKYNIEIELSGIWKYNNSAGIFLNIISLKK